MNSKTIKNSKLTSERGELAQARKYVEMIVEITKIIDDDCWPAVVECKFSDAYGKEHTINEKFPIVTSEIITPNSTFPQKGMVRCSLLKKIIDKDVGLIIEVSTEIPDYVESLDGLSKFNLFTEQVVE